MNRKLLVALFVISLFFNLVFIVFAYVQKVAADGAIRKAEQAQIEAERQALRAIVCMQQLETARK